MAEDNYQADFEMDGDEEDAPPTSSALTSMRQTASMNKSSIGRGIGFTNSGDHQKYTHHTTPHVRRNQTQPGLKLHSAGMPILHTVHYSPVFQNSHLQADKSPSHAASYIAHFAVCLPYICFRTHERFTALRHVL